MTKSPRGVDLFDVNAFLTDDQIELRDTVRTFATETVRPLIKEYWRRGTFPKELAPKLGAMGLLGGHLDLEDSPGMDALSLGLTMVELERADAAVRSFVSVQGCLVMGSIARYGSPAQKERWLKALARGEAIGAFALTELDHGCDTGAMSCAATRSGDHWILDGHKMWCTNGSMADVVVLWARSAEGVRAYLVERDTPGFTSTDVPGLHCMRMSVVSNLHFKDCVLPEEAVLPGVEHLRDCLRMLNDARFCIAFGAVGAAEDCLEEALTYLAPRTRFSRPLTGFQLVQAKLADVATSLTRSQLLVLQMARLKDAGSLRHEQVSLAKRSCVRAALESARICRDLLGAQGITDGSAVFRHMANLEAQSTVDGTEHIHGLIVGQSLTGYPAFS